LKSLFSTSKVDANQAAMARALQCMSKGDLKGAVNEVSHLEGIAAGETSIWLQDAKERVIIENMARALDAHINTMTPYDV